MELVCIFLIVINIMYVSFLFVSVHTIIILFLLLNGNGDKLLTYIVPEKKVVNGQKLILVWDITYPIIRFYDLTIAIIIGDVTDRDRSGFRKAILCWSRWNLLSPRRMRFVYVYLNDIRVYSLFTADWFVFIWVWSGYTFCRVMILVINTRGWFGGIFVN